MAKRRAFHVVKLCPDCGGDMQRMTYRGKDGIDRCAWCDAERVKAGRWEPVQGGLFDG